MPTITFDQYQKLRAVTKSLAGKHRLDKPIDVSPEIAILLALGQEIFDQNEDSFGNPDIK
jgi:hypothetical protein